ncbi:hypothetical protein EYF80_024650 [Liparis tanakae]|uniref:Uncharacterized protein n=1 Tax=Liparis tanakae TaxID=230148 RepID=A0A4Z2HHQ7_9TELE|nr:hypothetical protein EYF80_024650 [Liparis tanakae]
MSIFRPLPQDTFLITQFTVPDSSSSRQAETSPRGTPNNIPPCQCKSTTVLHMHTFNHLGLQHMQGVRIDLGDDNIPSVLIGRVHDPHPQLVSHDIDVGVPAPSAESAVQAQDSLIELVVVKGPELLLDACQHC